MQEIAGHNWRVIIGDVRDGLRTLPDNSVQCCVTSPPYWGLRDYGCEGQIGLEPTPEAFTAAMVEVFEEVRRVLRPDGVCFVNIGDSYCSTDKWGGGKSGNTGKHTVADDGEVPSWAVRERKQPLPGLKPKDLCGIPWRLAFALQSAGWWLRSEIIWHKRTPMPESVTDRPTKSHEQIFLLTKSADYFWDQQAVKEPATVGARGSRMDIGKTGTAQGKTSTKNREDHETRNIRTVWTLSAESFTGAHFATFPSSIPLRCIKAGTSERGCCPHCGAPWERITRKTPMVIDRSDRTHTKGRTRASGTMVQPATARTTGWQPTCGCLEQEFGEPERIPSPVPCVVLDPFSGSGTTGMVATEMGRIYVGCELNPEYADMSRTRIESWKKRDTISQTPSLFGQKELFP